LDTSFKNPRISLGGTEVSILHEFHEGEYAEFGPDDGIRIFDRNGILLTKQNSPENIPTLQPSENRVGLESDGSGTGKFTVITLGQAIQP
jgi:hypothetical protein